MTNTELIQAIRNEIEKLIERYGSVKAKGILQEGYKGGRLIGYEDALNILKRIQENLEKPSLVPEKPIEGLEEEIQNMLEQYVKLTEGRLSMMKPSGLEKIARHFAKWGAEHLKK